MYHPSRGGVRGGRDQFTWDDVKVDKHRENYLGHSLKAPVGRWQKGKDLHWYTRDKDSKSSNSEAMKEEIRRIKEEEEQAMREALGLAPKRSGKSHVNRLDKHEFAELVKRGSTAEDLGAGHAEAAQVQGLGFLRGASHPSEESSLPSSLSSKPVEKMNVSVPATSARNDEKESEDESSRKKRKNEEKKRDKHERREKRHSRDSDDKRKHKKHKEKKRYDSD
ncbi:leukocyte immunoglobulin-like receptor family A protein [Perilla frutescens var. hirtella]|nr:leukocyte immunoglobulin-like receptor family A protein [Perilla frutescens var. hirtella]KAH6805740.1 leukocyte immunoglobulin-like receptor family A protein [Perilla frutescens var. frutescens]